MNHELIKNNSRRREYINDLGQIKFKYNNTLTPKDNFGENSLISSEIAKYHI